MTVATVDRPPIRLTEMGRREAEEVTLAIKNNFDSLGSMLLQARDRKAYKALGYKNFDTYCKTEFGKSISHAYQLIEDVKVIASLEAEISKQYDEPITLKIPSSHLRPLKELPEMGDKLKAIEYANKLATAEGKQPTKKHLEIAVFQISGDRSDDFKSAIEGLGFTKGTPVEMVKTLKQDRGFVTKVDKRGKIYVEIYSGGAVPIPCDASDLRILKDSEKPVIPASDNTINKGDKVRIFRMGLEGKTGEIYTWKMGKHAMVLVEGESAPTTIAYAELELIKDNDTEAINVEKVARWEDSNWTSGDSKYYYFARENRIYNTSWPTSLTLTPDADYESPIEFMNDWMERFGEKVIKSLSADSTNPVLPDKAEVLRAENQKLREQLAEAESAIEAMINAASAASPLEPSQSTEFPVENVASAMEAIPQEIPILHSQEILERIARERDALLNKIEAGKSIMARASKKESGKISRTIDNLTRRLQDLEAFERFNLNQPVTKRHNREITGRISGFEFSQGGMPLVWVIWKNNEGEDEKIPENLPVASIVAASET
jgi:hypothetical protein